MSKPTSSSSSAVKPLPALMRVSHVAHCNRCLAIGLPATQVDVDSARMAVGYYCIGTLDLLGLAFKETKEKDRESWREWIWGQQTKGRYGSGFRPSPFMTARAQGSLAQEGYTGYDTPHIIMTYTALLTLAILRDDFSNLDRKGLVTFLTACQKEDGSFSTVPHSGENDLRTLYCAFAISAMLDDWSGIDVQRAVDFVASCRSYEGGYGQSPFCEAQGGTTYIAIAALYLAPVVLAPRARLTEEERTVTVNWLIRNQDESGGFRGRTNKLADACYCFWCGAALHILGAQELVDKRALAMYLGQCQFKYGGISKAPNEHPDPYHTYLSLASLAMYNPYMEDEKDTVTWQMEPLDPLLNARVETAMWAKRKIPDPKRSLEEDAMNVS